MIKREKIVKNKYIAVRKKIPILTIPDDADDTIEALTIKIRSSQWPGGRCVNNRGSH